MLVIRPEESKDYAAVYEAVSAAFETTAEAELVKLLRSVSEVISLVAEINSQIIGHIMFSPVSLIDEQTNPIDIKIAGLAPVAVAPAHQKTGVGKALIEAGLETCQKKGFVACFLLGHPNYYPKFGFSPAFSTFSIQSTYNVPDPVFMALELQSGALEGLSGIIHYHSTFNGV